MSATELVKVEQRLEAIGGAAGQAKNRIIVALPAEPSADGLVGCDLDAVINEVGELSKLKVQAEQLFKDLRTLRQAI